MSPSPEAQPHERSQRDPRPRTSLTRSLVLRFVAAGLVPLLAGAALLIAQGKSSATAAAHGQARDRASATAEDLSRMFGDWRSQLLIAADNPALLDWYRQPERRGVLRPQVEASLLTLHRLYPDLIDESCFIDAAGPELARQVAGQAAAVEDLSPDESDNPFFAATLALAAGQVHQNSPYVSPDSGRWVVSNSTPLVLGGRQVASLHFEANLEAIRARMAADAGRGLVVRVVDPRTGRVIADSRDSAPLVAQPLPRSGSRPLPASWQTASASLSGAPGDEDQWRVEVAAQPAAALDATLITELGLLALLAGAVLTLLGRRAARTVVQPLRRVTEVAHALAAGDLTQRASVDRQDEIGQAAAAVDAATEALHTVVSGIAAQAGHLAEAADQLTAATVQIQDNAERTGSTARVASDAAHHVAGNVLALRASAEQMGSSIREISSVAAEAAATAAGAAETGGATHDTMRRLGRSSAEIDSVVQLISTIAGQTNLLALNATIEAARAGEAGKGFAVVAGEVKDLARQTAGATADITERIAGIQSDAGGAVAAITDITRVVEQVSEHQSRIAAAVEEQTVTTGAMGDSVAQTAASTEEIAASLAGVAQAAATTTSAVAAARGATERLARVSTDLQALVGGFRR